MIEFTALPTGMARALQDGGSDAYGHKPENSISDGQGKPCRHCLRQIPKGGEMLILAHRPFDDLHPYAETGPIFLCARHCERGGGRSLPEVLQTSPDYLIKGYSAQDRIVYGTGAVVEAQTLTARAETILDDPGVAYVHVRSSRNNCYLVRIDRTAKDD